MEEYGDLLKHEHNNTLDDEETVLEEILKEFALSCESESYSPQTQTHNNNAATPYNVPSFYGSTVVATTCHQSCGRDDAKEANQTTTRSVHHIMAERKRRQDLSQKFIALSAIVPGLHKIDKISILKETIAYVKHLQNQVRELEEHGLSLRKINVESVSTFIDKTHVNTEKDTNYAECSVAFPKVEARVFENDVLIRIHCDKHKGVLLKILRHITCLGFSAVRTSVLPFGNCSLCITIIAQMGDKCKVTMKDLVKSLRRVVLE